MNLQKTNFVEEISNKQKSAYLDKCLAIYVTVCLSFFKFSGSISSYEGNKKIRKGTIQRI